MSTKELRVAVVGAGRWAQRAHVPGWQRDPRVEVAAVALGGAAGPEAFEAGGGFALLGGFAAKLDAGFGFAIEGLGDGGGAALLGEGEDFDFVFDGAGIDAEEVSGLDGAGGLGGEAVGEDAAEVAGAGGEGAGLEEAGGPEPLVDADAVHDFIFEDPGRCG